MKLKRAITAPKRYRGVTLIELMIGLVLGLVIMMALVELYAKVSRTNQEMAKSNSQIENARFAIQIMQDDFVHAGYWGGFIPQFDDLSYSPIPDDVPTALPAPCLAYASWDADGNGVLDKDDDYVNGLLAIPVQFYNGIPAGCSGIVTNKRAGTDVVVVRHADTCFPGGTNCDTFSASVLYFQPSRCEAEVGVGTPYFLGTKAAIGDFPRRARDCAALAPFRKFVSHIYYVRNCATLKVDGTCNDTIPTLMRSEFGVVSGAPAFSAAVPLIEGIEDFRIELGVDGKSETNANVNYTEAVDWVDPDNREAPTNRGDGVPETYTHCAAGCSVAQLMNVSAAKIYILARADKETLGYTDTKTYTLGTQAPFTPSGTDVGYKRHVFSTTVQFVNITIRRETP